MSAHVPGRLIVGVDGSEHSDRALRWATDQALLEHRGMTLVHAVPSYGAPALDVGGHAYLPGGDAASDSAREVITRARTEVGRWAPEVDVADTVTVADPREALIEASRDASLVVLGSRGRGRLRSVLLGSVSAAVAQHAACPVVVHRPGNPGLVRNGVLAGVDESERSRPVLQFAFRVAAQRDLPLTVMHSFSEVLVPAGPAVMALPPVDVDEEHRALAETVAGFGERYPEVRVRLEVSRGVPAVDLARRAERMNLLVVGAHHGGLPTALLFGSVSAGALEHATCPVAVVPTT